jgi:hypothetical protein
MNDLLQYSVKMIGRKEHAAMKARRVLIRTLFIAGLSMASPARGEFATANAIAPEDLGAVKWRVTGTGGQAEVVVFRMIRRIGGKVSDAHDFVHHHPGKEVVETIFAINPDFFRRRTDGKQEWHLAAFGGSAWIQGKKSESFSDGKTARLKFVSDMGEEITYEFFCLVMKHADAAKMYGEKESFPSIKDIGLWAWGGTPSSVE